LIRNTFLNLNKRNKKNLRKVKVKKEIEIVNKLKARRVRESQRRSSNLKIILISNNLSLSTLKNRQLHSKSTSPKNLKIK